VIDCPCGARICFAHALSRVLNEHAAISPEMALRIEAWLGIERGGRADVWLARQAAYDLWQARQNSSKLHVKYAPAEPAH
jgi:antitoxin HigA-1